MHVMRTDLLDERESAAIANRRSACASNSSDRSLEYFGHRGPMLETPVTKSGTLTRWVVGAIAIAMLAAFVGYWNRDLGAPKRFCGPEAHAQLRSAIDEMNSVIPASALRVMDDCDSGSEVYAAGEVDDLDTLLTNARAFGCRFNDSGLRNDEHEFLNCNLPR